jgi:hypothetical protein
MPQSILVVDDEPNIVLSGTWSGPHGMEKRRLRQFVNLLLTLFSSML